MMRIISAVRQLNYYVQLWKEVSGQRVAHISRASIFAVISI